MTKEIEIDLSQMDPDLLARFKRQAKLRRMTLEETVEAAFRLLFTSRHPMRDLILHKLMEAQIESLAISIREGHGSLDGVKKRLEQLVRHPECGRFSNASRSKTRAAPL